MARAKMIKAVAFLFCLTVLACTGPNHGQKTGTPSSVSLAAARLASPECVVVLIDGTGSYQHLNRATRIARLVPASLPGDSLLYMRWITANSLGDDAGILSTVLPANPKAVDNPFDRGEKLARARALSGRRATLLEIDKVLASLRSPKAGHTDIAGALMAASMRFAEHPSYQARLIIFSDLQDNLHLPIKGLSLKGVSVAILGFQVQGPETLRLRNAWVRHFKALGADQVTFRYLDDPLVADAFRGTP